MCRASPMRCGVRAWSVETASSSTSPWCPRRSSPCWRAPGSARSTPSSSAASLRPSSPPESMMRSPRRSSPLPAVSRAGASCPTSRLSTRRAPSPSTGWVRALCCSARNSPRRWERGILTGSTPSRVHARSTRLWSRRPTRFSSSTHRAPRVSRRASCVTTAGTPSPWRGACRMSMASARMMSGGRLPMSGGSSATPTSPMRRSSPDARP